MYGNVVKANPITVNDAMQRAKEYFSSGKARRVKGNLNLTLAYTMKDAPSTSVNVEAAWYAFNIGEGNGFIIVSGDDVAVPVLGYCDTGSFDADNIPSNVKAWLDGYVEQIQKARSHEGTTGNKTFNAAPKKSRSKIEAMLTSAWNQDEPFNDQCVFNGTRCLTGCLAAAMAQMMYFWATKGKDGKTYRAGCKALDGYTTKTNGYVLEPLPAISSFDWDNMTDEKPTTTASKNAIAQLIRYCGQALQANFGPSFTSGSMAKTADALKNYCGYNLGISLENEYYYNPTEWDEMVYAQLAERKPVIIQGEGSNGGHAFICDGYDPDTDTYHMNWGWGGRYDGWFAMTSLNPENYVLNDKKFAIININPNEESTYAVLSTDQKTLSFYHDTEKDAKVGTIYQLNTSYNPDWAKVTTITDVVFDSSFANATPTTTEYWFVNQENLKNITGLQYLNTSNVTSMTSMFSGCSQLENIDVSHFNTSNVMSMTNMFNGCSNLKNVDVSHFNTSNVTSMTNMFKGCSNLTSLDLSSFDMNSYLVASNMINSCSSLKDFYVPASMPELSAYTCSGVGTQTSPCIIHAPEGFNFGEGVDTSALSFKWYSGNFYLLGTVLPYAIIADGTLTFCYDNNPWNREETKYRINASGTPSWYSARESVSSVIFDKSFVNYSPVSAYQWFAGMVNLTTIEDLENLNCSNLESVERMFYGCTGLTSLDLSSLDMSHVTNAAYMLYNCKELKHLYVSPSMSSLANYQNVCNAIGNTTACIIHVPDGFDFGEGVDASALSFKWCNGKFYVFGTDVAYSMLEDDVLKFYYDAKAWERGLTPWAMNATSNPAWTTSNTLVKKVVFDSSFAQARPVSTYRWFYGMTGLTNIEGLNFLNTTNVTNMTQMFYNCSGLTSLNLGKFDMTNVEIISNILYGCSGLKELHIHESMTKLATNACSNIGTADSPCTLYAPENFDFGVDISGEFFRWKQGYFSLGHQLVLLGDVNDDGLVNISDVVTLVNYILGQDPSPFISEAADINEDNQINISDVVALVGIILSAN